MKRLTGLGLLLLVLAGAGALVFSGASGASNKRTYKIIFDNAFGLTQGGDLRVGGVKAGKTTGFDVLKKGHDRPVAVVTATVDQPGIGDFRADASCEIKPQSLIGEYYVDCEPGSSPRRLKGGATIGVNHTSSTIALDSVQDILRAPYRERLRILLDELGTGLAGRSQDLAAVLRRADPGLRETDKTLSILAGQNRQLTSFIKNADTVIAPLDRERAEVVRWIHETGKAAQITATRRAALQATIHRFPGFLDQLRPTMASLGTLADRQVPLLTDLRRGAPSLDTFLTRLAPFATASRPALRALGGASTVGTKAIRDSRQEVSALNALAALAPATGTAPDQQGVTRPLRQFLASLDDRRRSGDETSRAESLAAATAPPAPDPTHIAAGTHQGFTTMEDIWNYPYWQSLAINGYDSIGHILRVSALISKCAGWQTGPITDANRQTFADCNQWLGPNQPGVTTPDPTRTGSTIAARTLLADDGKPAAARSLPRSEGQPAEGPVAGQPDRSKPSQSLPPGVNGLVDKLLGTLTGHTASGGQGSGASSAASPASTASPADQARLLDFLLGP
jgi:virulence factor Mce-like protein